MWDQYESGSGWSDRGGTALGVFFLYLTEKSLAAESIGEDRSCRIMAKCQKAAFEDDSNFMPNMPAQNHTNCRQKVPRTHQSAEAFGTFLGLFALFAAMTAILFYQWMPHLHSALIGPPEDNLQDFWNTWYAAVGRNPGSFFLPM